MPNEPVIFISYRRRDAGGHGRALHEYLSGRFGDERVFFDQSTIESGDVFPDRLRRGVEECTALLALIGPEWLDVRGDDGGRRLDDANDFVRREIALALEQGKKVIAVLFDDAQVPPRDRLPDPLKALASCDALTLRGKTYEYQTQRRELVRLLAKVPGMPQPLPEAKEAQMTDASDGKRDFFISFNQADRAWATWIAWVLEESGHSVFFQDWDFRGNFIEQMHQASQRAARTLVVLSDHYLHSASTLSEAWAALARDPVGREDRVVIVKVGPTTKNLGLLSHFGYLDLTTSAGADAERLILERVRKAVEPDYRAKPSTRPGFPGSVRKKRVLQKPVFPEAATAKPTKVFIIYSHGDEKWLERLKRHLNPLVREGRLDHWDDTHIRPGDNWQQEIRNALDTAQVAVLLISPDFLASDFINKNILPPLLAAARAKRVRILPVILSASRFAHDPRGLAEFQAVNSPDKPLSALPRSAQEEVFDRIAEEIESSFSLEYYVQTRGGPLSLNEAKLIFVGFGGVGKISLVNRLINDRFDLNERKTEGISITDWPITIHDQQIYLHVWDFGGQEIMHATHQFFLTQQSLYILVLTGRQGREDADAEYWLNQIVSFAADSPVIIVPHSLNRF